ncbi:MAG: sigma-70 family RNA polymerase sigma factor [Candidatus Latescibacteria bacterium]|nr:sigma-70 family RNA polymerase sigma factor [Candidatus Latescibacterota bacterium]
MAEKDRTLVNKVLQGDADAYAELIDRYAGLVHGLVLERVRRPDEVEDIMQEVFAKAYTHLATLRQPNRFGPWVASIAANLATNWWRRNRLRLEVEAQGEDHFAPNRNRGPDEQLEEREAFGVVWEALDRLPPEYRRVVVLYHLEGCRQRDIARFMQISVHTVKWRLRRAQSRMQAELGDILGREMAYRSGRQRQLKEKLLAGLPLVPLFRFPQPKGFWDHWTRRGLALVGGAGTLALSGMLLVQEVQFRQEETRDQHGAGGLRVRYQPMDLPQASFSWGPRRPQAGEQVRLQWASATLPDEGPAYLHYTTDLRDPRDQVVEMRRDKGDWIATVEVPSEASNIFFYAAPEAQPQQFSGELEQQILRQQLRRYTGALAIHDDRGRPVRNAEYGLGTWASISLDRFGEESLRHYDRELARFPDHARANTSRWYILQETAADIDSAHAQVQAEKVALTTRFPDDAELAWTIIGASWEKEALRDFERRFPDHKNAPAAAYRATFELRHDHLAHIRALEQFLRTFSRSAYTDDVYRDLLYAHDRNDRVRGKALADSLISRITVPYFDLEVERTTTQWGWSSAYEGALPEARAYTLRFKWHMEEGDTTAALDLARRLVRSGLRDPIPYVLIGRQLAALDSTSDLGLEVLEAGLPWTDPDHMLTLPYFAPPEEDPMDRTKYYRRKMALEWRIPCLQELGRVYLEGGACARAAQQLGETTILLGQYKHNNYPFDDRAFLMLGQAHSCVGEWDQATDAYMALVRRYYNHPEAEAALEELHRQRYGDLSRWRVQRGSVWVPAPAFRAADAVGDSLNLSGQGGRPVLLFCDWRQSGPWQDQDLQQFAAWRQRYEEAGAKVIFATKKTTYWTADGVPYRHEDALADRMREGGHSFPVFFADEEAYKDYATTFGGLVVFLVDRAGRLRLRQDRNTETDRQAYNSILEAKLEELLGEGDPTEPVAHLRPDRVVQRSQ